MNGLRITGNPDETELAVLLAVLGRGRARPVDRLGAWRVDRRAAVRRSAQQTR